MMTLAQRMKDEFREELKDELKDELNNKRNKEIAKSMKSQGEFIGNISNYTGLSKKEIEIL